MRVLFVIPTFNGVGQYYPFPIGLGLLAAIVENAGHEVTVLDLNYHHSPDKVAYHFTTHQAMLMGGICIHYPQVKETLLSAKKVNPRIKTVLGGGIFSCAPEAMLQTLPIDYGVVGEGEQVVLKVLSAIETNTPIPALQKATTLVSDLDSLPFPAYHLFDMENYFNTQLPTDEWYHYPLDKPRLLPMLLSRGCPYNCTFCWHPIGHKHRTRSLDNFFQELDLVVDRYGVNIIALMDELFINEKERMREFCRRIKPYNVLWAPEFKVNVFDEEMAAMVKDAGCFCIGFGIESCSNPILKSMKKGITKEEITNAANLCEKYNIGIEGNLLFFDPAETEETSAETLQWWLDYPQHQFNIQHLYPYPNSALFQHYVKEKAISGPIPYMETGCPYLPKQISPTLKALFEKVETYSGNRGKVLKAELTSFSTMRNTPLLDLQVHCPHCGRDLLYKNFALKHKRPKIGCRHCHRQFNI